MKKKLIFFILNLYLSSNYFKICAIFCCCAKNFSNIGLNIEPNVNDIDSWRIYYNYQYTMIYMNNKFSAIESNNLNISDNESIINRGKFSNYLLNQLKLIPLKFTNKCYPIAESFINCICCFSNL